MTASSHLIHLLRLLLSRPDRVYRLSMPESQKGRHRRCVSYLKQGHIANNFRQNKHLLMKKKKIEANC